MSDENINIKYTLINPELAASIEKSLADARKGVDAAIRIKVYGEEQLQDLLSTVKHEVNVKVGLSYDSTYKDFLALTQGTKKIQVDVDLSKAQAAIDKFNKPIKIKFDVDDSIADVQKKLERAILQSNRISSVGFSSGAVSSAVNDPRFNRAVQSFQGNPTTISNLEAQLQKYRDIDNQKIAQQLQFQAQRQTQAGFVPLNPGDLARFNQQEATNAFQDSLRNSISSRKGPSSVIGGGLNSIDAARYARDNSEDEVQIQAARAKNAADAAEQARISTNRKARLLEIRQTQLVERSDSLRGTEGFEELNPGDLASFNRRAASRGQQTYDSLSAIEARRNQGFEDLGPAGLLPKGTIANKLKQINAAQTLSQSKDDFQDVLKNTALGSLNGQGFVSLGGSFLGGLVGSAAGPGGAAVGSLVGGAVGQTFEKTIGAIAETLEHASEAGLEFQKSVLSIASVYQATSKVVNPDGSPLSLADQIPAQFQRAESTQLKARAQLVPLGITGDKEAALVRSIAAGAAQAGLNLDPDQIATLARRFGGAIQAQRPDLLNNFTQTSRDVEGFFTNTKSTVFSNLVNPFAQGARGANNVDDLLQRTKGLEAFAQVLTSSGGNAALSLQKLNGAVDQLNTAFGTALTKALVPGIDEFAKALQDPALLKGLETLGKALGGIANFGIKTAAGTAESANLVGSAAAGYFDPALDHETVAVKAQSAAVNSIRTPLSALIKQRYPNITDEQLNNALDIASGKKEQFGPPLSLAPNGGNVLPNAVTNIGGKGILDFNQTEVPTTDPQLLAKLLNSPEQQENITRSIREEFLSARAASGEDGDFIGPPSAAKDASAKLLAQQANVPLANLNSLLDKAKDLNGLESVFGSGVTVQRAGLFNAAAGQASNLVDARKAQVDKAQRELDESAGENDVIRLGKRNELIEATRRLDDAELALAHVRQDQIGIAEQLSNRLRKDIETSVNSTDEQTLAGQAKIGQTNINGIQARIQDLNLRQKAGTISDEDFNDQVGPLQKQLLQQQRANNPATNSLKAGTTIAQADGAIVEFTKIQNQTGARLQSYADALAEATQSLQDFKDDAKVRKFGREGQRLSAADAVLSAGGSELDVDHDVDLTLVKGSSSFDPERRKQFEARAARANFNKVVRETDPFRTSDEDDRTQRGLELKQNDAEFANRAAPAQLALQQFQALGTLKQLDTQLDGKGAAGKAVRDLLSKNLDVDNIRKITKDAGLGDIPDSFVNPKGDTFESKQGASPLSSIDSNVASILSLLGGKPAAGSSGDGSSQGASLGGTFGTSPFNPGAGLTSAIKDFDSPLFNDVDDPLSTINSSSGVPGVSDPFIEASSGLGGDKGSSGDAPGGRLDFPLDTPTDLLRKDINTKPFDNSGSLTPDLSPIFGAKVKNPSIASDIFGGLLDGSSDAKTKNARPAIKDNQTSAIAQTLKSVSTGDNAGGASDLGSALEKQTSALIQGFSTAFTQAINGI